MSELQEETKDQLSEDDKELLIRGIRPEWMDKGMYKNIRKRIQNATKEYLKGKLIYVSKEFVNETDPETGKKVKKVKTYPPYVKKAVKS